MNILVTGGAGFIGSHVVVELVESGYKPIILDNFDNSERSVIDQLQKLTGQTIKLYEGDFGNTDLIDQIIQTEHIDGVIHFAAYKAVEESVNNPLKYYKNNVSNLVSLLTSMEKYEVSNLVFSSSCTVYGEALELPIVESEPIKPATSPYGTSKQFDEKIIQDVTFSSKSLKSIALRYFNPIGAHPSGLIGELPIGVPSNLVPYITQTAAGIRDKIIIHGNDYPTPDGTCIRDYIHVVDLAKAHVKALEHLNKQPVKYNDEFNIGTGKGSSVLDVIKTFEETTNIKLNFEIGPRRSGDIISAYASVKKANDTLGWKSEFDLSKSLADSWNWQQKVNKNS